MHRGGDYPRLRGFLSGYYNQDWMSDYSGDDELVQDFLSGNPETIQGGVRDDLVRLLKTVPPDELTDDFLFDELWCYASSDNNAAWLRSLLAKLGSVS